MFNYSVKPTLKKVSKYENKFAKLQKKAAEFNFRNQLKVVKKKEFTLEEEDKEVSWIFFRSNFLFKFYLQKILQKYTNQSSNIIIDWNINWKKKITIFVKKIIYSDKNPLYLLFVLLQAKKSEKADWQKK